tara:strand:- start:2456 stop:2929 length:474 start_codon:yes stop_codon:yes gene_type:complete
MLNTPKWIIDMLEAETFKCPHCGKPFNPAFIQACGLRMSFRKGEGQVLYVEYHCQRCKKQPSLLELYNLEFDQFARQILEIDEENMITRKKDFFKHDKKDKRKKKSSRKSKITQAEIDSVKKLLKESPTHIDFLTSLGMSPEDIEIKSSKENESENI